MMDGARTSYSVMHTRGCRVIIGALPICDLVALTNAWSERAEPGSDDEWLCDALLSQHLNVNLVCGPKHATEAWRAELGLTAPTP